MATAPKSLIFMRRYVVTDFTWHFLTIFYKMDVSMKIKYFKLVQNSRPYANNMTYIYARTYFLSASCVSEFPLPTSYDSELHVNLYVVIFKTHLSRIYWEIYFLSKSNKSLRKLREAVNIEVHGCELVHHHCMF